MPRTVSPASSASPEVSAALCLPVCEMGRGGSLLSRGHPALRLKGLMRFQKRGPSLRLNKPPVLLDLPEGDRDRAASLIHRV